MFDLPCAGYRPRQLYVSEVLLAAARVPHGLTESTRAPVSLTARGLQRDARDARVNVLQVGRNLHGSTGSLYTYIISY